MAAASSPPRWTELIEAYARHGHTLAEDGPDPEAPTVDQRTRTVPQPGPTLQYTRDVRTPEQERRRKREEQERGEAERAEHEKARRKQTERQRAERARAEAQRRKQERQSLAGTGAAVATGRSTRPRASGTAPAGGRATGAADPGRTAPANPSGTGNGTDIWKGIAGIVAALVFFFYVLPTVLDSSDSSSGRSSPTYFPTPTPPPTLEPEDRAFVAVRTGDCLNAYGNGYGEWSSSVPERVHCDSADAYLRVTAVGHGTRAPNCPSGNGRGKWTHTTATDTDITLCLARQYRKGQCFPAKINKDNSVSADLMVVWSCSRDTVPQGYNQILQITGYFKAPRSLSGNICPSTPGRYYWYWLVDGKKNLICTEIA